MWNRFLQLFYFNWNYSVPRLLSYRYRQRKLWTYFTDFALLQLALLQLTFSTMVNSTNSCTVQLWGLQFLLLWQKLWCRTSRKAPFRLADKRYRFGYTTLTILSLPFNTTKSTHSTTTLTVKALTNSLREVEENGKLPFLDCLVSRDDNSLRTTVYRKPIYTDRLMDESSYNPTSHRATAIRTLTRRAQLVRNTTDSLSDEKNYFHRVFQRTTTTKTSFNVTLTDLLLLPRITTTQLLRLQQLYCT